MRRDIEPIVLILLAIFVGCDDPNEPKPVPEPLCTFVVDLRPIVPTITVTDGPCKVAE